MNGLLLSLMFVNSVGNTADFQKLTCVFTEPFALTTYDYEKQSLLVETPSMGRKPKQQLQQMISFHIRDTGLFSLIAADGSRLHDLTLNNTGSDGMSDRLYPYRVTRTWNKAPQIGGCFSDKLPAQEHEL